jgi:hypothetical protein
MFVIASRTVTYLVWVWSGLGLGLVWVWAAFGLGLVWVWRGCVVGLVWIWCGFGVGLGLIWIWPGFDLGLVWVRSESGLGTLGLVYSESCIILSPADIDLVSSIRISSHQTRDCYPSTTFILSSDMESSHRHQNDVHGGGWAGGGTGGIDSSPIPVVCLNPSERPMLTIVVVILTVEVVKKSRR